MERPICATSIECVSARAIQVAFVVDEHLRLVDQAAESAGMHDAIAIALVFAAVLGRRLGMPAARELCSSCAA